MTDPISQVLNHRFESFTDEVSRSVVPPGTDVVRQLAARRQRVHAVSLAVLLLLVGVGGGVALGAIQGTGRPAVPGASATTASPSSSPTTSPTPSPTEQTPTSPPVDLSIVGDASVGMQYTGGHYAGTLYLTLRNIGPTPYKRTIIYLTLPAGISLDNPSFGGCVAAQAPETWQCFTNSIPALGGTTNLTVPLLADFAQQKTDTPIDGFAIRVAADLATGVPATDLSPDDNTLHTRLVLLGS